MMPEYIGDADTVIPPQNLDAEQAVLGAILLGGANAARGLAALDPGDYYRDAHRYIHQAAVDVAAGDGAQSVDMVTVATRLREAGRLDDIGGFDYLDRLVRSTPYSDNVERYAQVVSDCAMRRRLIVAAQRLQASARDLETPVDQVVADGYAAYTDVAAGAARGDGLLTGPEAVALWRERSLSADRPILTGFPKLDHALRGGWRRKQVHVLTARTRMGKSSLVCGFISACVDQGIRCGLASLEMELDEVLARIVSIRTGIPYCALENGPDTLAHELGHQASIRASDEAERIMAYLAVDEASGYGIAEMSRRLRRLREEHEARFIVLDLLDRVSGEGSSDYERKAAVNAELQRLGHPRGLGVPILAVAQQNRQGAGRGRSSLETIKGCGDIEEASPVVMSLERDVDAEEHLVTGRLRLLKNRGGREVDIDLKGDWATMRWAEAVSSPAAPDWDPDPFGGDDE